MSNNCHIQTASCLLIAVPLNDSCQIVQGALVYTTTGFGSVTAEVEREDGTDYSARNAGGQLCGPQQQGDTLEKWLNVGGEFCLKDWAFMAATSGNPSVVDGDGNVVGYAALARQNTGPCVANAKPKVAVVVVRRSATGDGGCVAPTEDTGATAAVGHFFPNTTDWLWDIPNFEDARASIPFKAKGYTNARILGGPLNLWPSTYTPNVIPADAYHTEAFLDPADLPVPNCDTPTAHPVVVDPNH